MILQEISEDEFVTYANKSPYKTFLQTPQIGTIRAKKGWQVVYLGLYDNNNIVGATMLLSKNKLLGYKDFYAPRGVLCDYYNRQLTEEFIMKLIKYAKKSKAIFLRLDPYCCDFKRDIDGNRCENEIDNTFILEYLSLLGFQKVEHQEQVGTMFALDVLNHTEEELLSKMSSTTRNSIKKAVNLGVKIRQLPYEELDKFYSITENTSQRKSFSNKDLSYFQDMYNLFKDDIKYIVAEVDLKEASAWLETSLKNEREKLNKHTLNVENDGKRKSLLENINALEKRLEKNNLYQQKYGQKALLSAGMFITIYDEVIYLISGNYKELMNYCGQYLIQWEMIKYALHNGYKRYNFYGINSYFNKEDITYGIYEFKRGFNGYVEVLIGEHKLVIRKFINLVYSILSKIKR